MVFIQRRSEYHYYSYDVSLAIAKIYYDYLSANLEEAEYLQAMELAVLHHPVRMRLPSPVEKLAYLSTRGHDS